MAPLRIGTRTSALARAQSALVAEMLSARLDRETVLVDVSTTGDRSAEPLTSFGGSGVFVSALRDALLHDDVDVAVHSLKDLPTAGHDGVVLAGVPVRDDPRDVLVARDALTLAELPTGARVGTGAPRRAAQLHALGLDLEVVPIRGNVDTRVRKVDDGEVDAVVLARAGLARIGRLSAVTEVLDPAQMLPAPGQGALAVECRAADRELAVAIGTAIDDPATRAAVTAERTLLATLEAGCSAPVGALAELVDGELMIRAVVLAADGGAAIRMSATGGPGSAEELGRRLAEDLLDEGAGSFLGERV